MPLEFVSKMKGEARVRSVLQYVIFTTISLCGAEKLLDLKKVNNNTQTSVKVANDCYDVASGPCYKCECIRQ